MKQSQANRSQRHAERKQIRNLPVAHVHATTLPPAWSSHCQGAHGPVGGAHYVEGGRLMLLKRHNKKKQQKH